MNLSISHSINFIYNSLFQNIDYYLGTTFSKPTFVVFRVTEKCNSRCQMCPFHKSNKKELSTYQIKKILTNLKTWLGPFVLSISGGEPTIRNDIWEIIRFANNLGIKTVLCTNGTLITQKDIPKIINSGIEDIKISLDSLNSYGYQKIRGITANKKVLQTLHLLKEYTKDISISIHTVIIEQNINELIKLIMFTKDQKLNSITFHPIVLPGQEHDSKQELNHLWPNTQKINKTINEIIIYKRKGYPISNSTNYLNAIKDYYKNPSSVNKKCTAQISILRIDSKGQAHTCIPLGNIVNTPPKEIWNKESRKRLLKCKKSCAIAKCHTKERLIDRFRQFLRLNRVKK